MKIEATAPSLRCTGRCGHVWCGNIVRGSYYRLVGWRGNKGNGAVKRITQSIAALLVGALTIGASSPHSEMVDRQIKALSPDRVKVLRIGAGAGYAVTAELNGYPGPSNVLELAKKRGLTDDQRHATARAATATAKLIGVADIGAAPTNSDTGGSLTLANVLGDDDRRLMRPAEAGKFRSIGIIRCADGGIGTAFLITIEEQVKDVIVTATHTLIGKKGKRRPT